MLLSTHPDDILSFTIYVGSGIDPEDDSGSYLRMTGDEWLSPSETETLFEMIEELPFPEGKYEITFTRAE